MVYQIQGSFDRKSASGEEDLPSMSCKGAQGLVRSREQNVDIMARLLPGLTAATGMDALSYVVESYGNVWNRPINEGLALDAIELGRQT